MDYQKFFEKLLFESSSYGASDLHLTPGYYPTLRVDGKLFPLEGYNILDTEMTNGLLAQMLPKEQMARFFSEKEIDFSFSLGELRFRANAYFTKGLVGITLRFISLRIPAIEELNLSPIIKMFSRLSQGFILIVGPNGHGKSTTLASLLDLINHERRAKIVTIEDPIEYLFSPDKCIIDQRELFRDTLSFNRALKSTVRQNVDIIMVGEMRDYETMSAAVTAAETGHLVFASLHTNNAAQTIDRIIDSFPSNQQSQIRSQLASTISGIISQRLIPRIKGGLIPALEVLVANTAVRNLIREDRIGQLNIVIETSFNEGMISMNRSLADLVKRREISKEQAEFYSLDLKELRTLLR